MTMTALLRSRIPRKGDVRFWRPTAPVRVGVEFNYEAASGGPHPNWEEYDQAMRDEKRVLAIINVERMYPISS